MPTDLNRRDLLKTAAVFSFAALQLSAAEPNAPVFFKKDEFATLDKLTDLIIPTDEHSPGAHAAGVAAYIDWTAAHAVEPDAKSSWTKGLAMVDALSQEMFHKRFIKASKEQQLEIMTKLSGSKDETPEQSRFWGQLKNTTAFVYYSSSVGIHEDMEYKGNVLLEQFQGYDAT